MKVQIVINVVSVEQGKTNNYLDFKAYVGYFDANKLYKICYSGTEVNSSISLTEEQNDMF